MTVMKALILSGGGARGAYEAGAALALLQHERFDIICGTSIGAINGAFIAQDDAEDKWGSCRQPGAGQTLHHHPNDQSGNLDRVVRARL